MKKKPDAVVFKKRKMKEELGSGNMYTDIA